MVSKRVVLLEAAHEYESIVHYLAVHLNSPSAASAFMREFEHQLNLICENPNIYEPSRIPELASHDYRMALVRSHVMLYRHIDDTIYVAHVSHQSQNYARLV